MDRTAVAVIMFAAGALLADFTHPYGPAFWKAEAAGYTDSEVDCTDDCLEPMEPSMPPAQVMECSPSRDGSYLRCEVL